MLLVAMPFAPSSVFIPAQLIQTVTSVTRPCKASEWTAALSLLCALQGDKLRFPPNLGTKSLGARSYERGSWHRY